MVDTVPPALATASAYGTKLSAPDPTDERALVPELTTRTSNTYQETDGSRTLEAFAAPINYRDSTGAWQEIDNSLVDAPGSTYAVENEANDYLAKIPADPSITPIRFASDGAWVKVRMHGLENAPVVHGNIARFDLSDVADSVEYEATPTALKETIRLDQPPVSGEAPVFTYSIETSEGLTPELTGAGEIEFRAPDGDVPILIPAGTMFDSASDPAFSDQVGYQLQESEAGWKLSVTPDIGWLTSEDRVYPVLIDPSISNRVAVSDCFIAEQSPNSSYCSSQYIRAGRTAAGARRRGLLKFSVSSIPPAAVVSAATIYLYLNQDETVGTVGADYALQTPGKAWTTAATWTHSGTATWVGGAATGSMHATKSLTGSTSGYKNFTGAAGLVQSWLAGPNNGAIVRQVAETTNTMLSFYSVNGPVGKQPYMNVNYNTAPSDITDLGLEPCAGNCSALVSTSVTPTLRAMATDEDLGNLDYTFKVQAVGSTQTLETSPIVTAPQGTVAAWQVPASRLVDGGNYQFQVSVTDPSGAQKTSPWTAFSVDVDLPPGTPSDLKIEPCWATACTGENGTNTLTPELSAIVEDEDTGSLHLDFEVRTSAGGALSTSGSVAATSGQRATWTVPPGLLVNGATYEYRVGGRDATSTTWSDWAAFTVTLDDVPAQPTGVTMTPCLDACATWVTDTLTPSWTATSSDADSTTLDYDFELRALGMTTLEASGTDYGVEQATSARWLVPVGKLADNTTYQVRVSASDGHSTTWSEWTNFTVDLPSSGTPTTMPGHLITGTETWTAAESPYLLTGEVEVKPTGKLIIEPGTVIKFPSRFSGINGNVLVNGGQLLAEGSATRPIIMTSSRDDALMGDTDGNQGGPAIGDYGTGIRFAGDGTEGVPLSRLDNISLRYGAHGSGSCNQAYQNVSVDGGRVLVTNSEFVNNSYASINVSGGHAIIRNSRFAASGCAVVAVAGATELYENVFEADGGKVVVHGDRLTAIGNWIYGGGHASFSRGRNVADFYENAILANPAGSGWSETFTDLRHNWWGRPVGGFQPYCTTQGEAQATWPSVIYGRAPSCAGLGSYQVYGWFTDVLPAMDVPPPFPSAGLEGSPATPWGTALGQQFGMGDDFATRASGEQADPVNSATGSYVEQVTDAALPAIGLPVVAQRTYNSADTSAGALGQGWSLNYDYRLQLSGTHQAKFIAGDGQQIDFTFRNGAWRGASGVRAKLTAQGSGFELTTRAGMVLAFNSTGKPTSARDRNGQGVTFQRDAQGYLDTASNAGRVLDFDYTGNRLTKVTLPDGRYVQYGYTNGLLTSVRDTEGDVTRYSYDSTSGRLTSTTNPLDVVVMRIDYDPSTGRVSDQWDALNKRTRFAWDAGRESATMTDPRGGTWVDDYENGVIARRTDPLGRTTRYSYDKDLRLRSVVNARGVTTTYGYNNADDLTTVNGPYGRVHTKYNSAHDPTTSTNARGVLTEFEYFPTGQLKSRTRSAGAQVLTESFTYTADGLVATEENAGQNTTTYGYNVFGDRTSITTPEGRKTTFTYDAAGRLKSTTSPRGHEAGAAPAAYTTTITYDDPEQTVTVTDPLGGMTTSTFDAAGRLATTRDALHRETEYHYDAAGHLTSVEGPDPDTTGVTRTYAASTYDDNGNVATTTDELGRVTTMTYNLANEVATTTRPGVSGVFTFSYDAAGNVTSVKDPSGATTTLAYNSQDRITGVDHPNTTPPTPDVSFTYDIHGNRATMTDGQGTVAYTYTPFEELDTVTRGAQTHDFDYGPTGLLTSSTGPGESHTYDYYDDGLLKSVKQGTTTLATYTYNADGMPISGAIGDGSTWSRGYDRNGQIESITDTATDGSTLLAETITRDAAGNPLQIRHADNTTDTYEYDRLDRLRAVCYLSTTCTGAADYIRWDYNLAGARTAETRPTGTTQYSYDTAGGWLNSTSGPSGTTTYTHDAFGRTTGDGTTSYTYNRANQLVTETTNGITTAYTYDGDGKRTAATKPGGTINFHWDPRTYQLTAETDGNGNTVRSYDHGLGTIGMDSPTDGRSYYHYDLQGSVRARTSATGAKQWSGSYEPYGLTRASNDHGTTAASNPLGWTGGYQDTSGDMHLRARQYDPATGAFLTPDPAQAVSTSGTYTYANSNPMTAADPYGLWPLDSIAENVNRYGPAVSGILGIASLSIPLLGPFALAVGAATAVAAGYIALDTCYGDRKGSCAGAIAQSAMNMAWGGAGGLGWAYRGGRVAANAGRTAARACSFAGTTAVLMADGTRKPIEDVQVGDRVIATDPETGEQVAKTVEHVFVHEDTVIDLVVDGEVITTTKDHPFWSVTDQRFERADQLAPGEKVLGADGRVITVSGLRLGTAREALAYNLSVQGIHTYHVGDDAILVHNSCFTSLDALNNPKSLEGLTPSQIDDLARNAGFEIRAGSASAKNPATRYYLPGTNGSQGFRVLPQGVPGQPGVKSGAYLKYFGGHLHGTRVPLGMP